MTEDAANPQHHHHHPHHHPIEDDNVQLGRRPNHWDSRNLIFSDYLGAALPDPPPAIYWGANNNPAIVAPNTNISWGMMKNDTQGDCVIAATGHIILLWNIFSGRGKIFPTDGECLDTYYEAGYWNWQRTGVGGGTSMSGMLNYWQNQGVPCGNDPNLYKGATAVANTCFNQGERAYVTIGGTKYLTFVRSINKVTSNVNNVITVKVNSISLETLYANTGPATWFPPNQPAYTQPLPSGTIVLGADTGTQFVVNNKSYHTVTQNGVTTITVTETPPPEPAIHKLQAYAAMGWQMPPPLWAQVQMGWTQAQVDAEVAKRNREVKLAIQILGCVYVSVELPLSIRDVGIAKPWDVVVTNPPLTGHSKPGSWGGHAITFIGYDDTYIYFVTWGHVRCMTWNFFNTYCDGGWAVYSGDWINPSTNLSPSGFDVATLLADVANIQHE